MDQVWPGVGKPPPLDDEASGGKVEDPAGPLDEVPESEVMIPDPVHWIMDQAGWLSIGNDVLKVASIFGLDPAALLTKSIAGDYSMVARGGHAADAVAEFEREHRPDRARRPWAARRGHRRGDGIARGRLLGDLSSGRQRPGNDPVLVRRLRADIAVIARRTDDPGLRDLCLSVLRGTQSVRRVFEHPPFARLTRTSVDNLQAGIDRLDEEERADLLAGIGVDALPEERQFALMEGRPLPEE
ncbi:hypothetical protein AB3X52_10735 [Nocardioides sp. DS6]|uniref:Uncharacterized protein n=1 Tax=Nocardioides eburneus TaxID=3231482 RepID=A0ABV3SYS1_9ACTN